MILFAYMAYKYEPTDRFWLRDDHRFEDEKDKDIKKLEESADKKDETEGTDNAALEYNNEHED